MKVLFLDFDGVLNSHAYFASRQYRKGADKCEFVRGSEHFMLDPVCVHRLNWIVTTTGADVVVSSSWRHGYSLGDLAVILSRRGFTGRLVGKTDDFVASATERGHEIAAWLERHKTLVERFVVLDDNSDMDGVRDCFVQTSAAVGLTREDAMRAIQILGA